MTTYIFEYKTGRSFKNMTIRAVDMTQARAKFDAARPARSNLMRVVEV